VNALSDENDVNFSYPIYRARKVCHAPPKAILRFSRPNMQANFASRAIYRVRKGGGIGQLNLSKTISGASGKF
jgi:hypothetical protein